MKKELTATAVAAAIALAGCGGDSNEALSYGDYSEAVSEVCSDNAEEFDSAINAISGELAEQGEALAEAITVYDDITAKVAAIDPPAELAEAAAAYEAAREDRSADFAAAQESADAGDTDAFNKSIMAANAAQAAEAEAASKLGAELCVPS